VRGGEYARIQRRRWFGARTQPGQALGQRSFLGRQRQWFVQRHRS
jgi:hypothetical protein